MPAGSVRHAERLAVPAAILSKEIFMKQTIASPHMTGEDVTFTVNVDSLKRECLIKKEALQQLSAMRSPHTADVSTMDVFRAFEGAINGVARRLVAAGVPGTPLVLTPNTFLRPPRRL
jgi:hypothetical protein